MAKTIQDAVESKQGRTFQATSFGYNNEGEEVAKFMGHSVDVHMGEYSDWVTKSNRRRSIAFARQRRAEFDQGG